MKNLMLHIADNIQEFMFENKTPITRKDMEKLADWIITEINEWNKEAYEARNER